MNGIYSFIDERHLPNQVDSIRRYYNETGWEHTETGYCETQSYVDQRPFAIHYTRKCMRRLQRYFNRGGEMLLDAGCGAIPHDEILSYGDRFSERLCLDISVRGLEQARHKLGDKGIYVEASISEIPLKNDSVDAFICANAIYQLPANDQVSAVLELWRVLKPGGIGIIVYWWNRSYLSWRFEQLARGMLLRPQLASQESNDKNSKDETGPSNISMPQSWFIEQRWPFRYQIDSYRILTNHFMMTYLRDEWRSHLLLKAAYALQAVAPTFAGRYGEFAALVIRKD